MELSMNWLAGSDASAASSTSAGIEAMARLATVKALKAFMIVASEDRLLVIHLSKGQSPTRSNKDHWP